MSRLTVSNNNKLTPATLLENSIGGTEFEWVDDKHHGIHAIGKSSYSITPSFQMEVGRI